MPQPSCLQISGVCAPLHGTLQVPCAKNSVLPLLAASLLCEGPVVLHQIPRLTDVAAAVHILRLLGCNAVNQGLDWHLECGRLLTDEIDPDGMRAMRSGVFFIAPVLLRMGRVSFVQPGGCDLGGRPVDIHIAGLVAMGAQALLTPERTVLSAAHGLHGCRYRLRIPSVGATETLLMAAALAEGDTLLENAAEEPEVHDLVRFLQACGADILRPAPGSYQIAGAPRPGTSPRQLLRGCEFTACGDRIWAATMLCAVAAVGGTVRLHGCPAKNLSCLPQLLQRAGCRFLSKGDTILMESTGNLKGMGQLSTGPFPAFSTDMAPLLGAALLRAEGETCITDTLFSHRFACAAGFCALGARVSVEENRMQINPAGTPFHAAALHAADLRGGAALVLAALQAEGKSTVTGCEYIDRGYEDITCPLKKLGVQIERTTPQREEE